MMNLPTPVLGEVTAITISSPDLEQSLAFYQKLGFSEIMRMDFPFPWIQISDGALLMMIRKDNNPYIALTYYPKDIDQSVKIAEDAGIAFTDKPKPTDMVKRYVFQSPEALNISLVHIPDGFTQPKGPTMLTMPQEDYFNPDKYVNKTCGMFGEFALPVADLDVSIAFWGKLGFVALSRYGQPRPWAILSDGLAVIGLHQTQEFTQPAITYFAKDMKEKIEHLKTNGLTNFVEVAGAANITLTTPEQQKFNLFSL